MKKKTALFIGMVFMLLTTAASAHNIGDVIGEVYYSPLDTYINNYPICAYYMDGRQVVCAEDLRAYGFNVTYVDSERALYIEPDYSVTQIAGQGNVKRYYYLQYRRAYDIVYSDIKAYLNGREIECFCIDGKSMIKIRDLEVLGRCEYSAEQNYSKAWIDGLPQIEYKPLDVDYTTKQTIVLDPGHGKSSWHMSDDEKIASGYEKRNGVWGEWRHWKNGTSNIDCSGSGCRGDRTCWYAMSNGDRDTEPEINLRNALAAKKYLETELGYNVRMTRTTNEENPSFSKRVSYCYPNNDMSLAPDAVCYICIHSNAGGGTGSAYIEAEGKYNQKWINQGYVSRSNYLGQLVNDKIVQQTSLSKRGNGKISGLGYMILFNKCPVPTGYLEIGFFDSQSDLNILNTQSDAIGKAIAYGINDYMMDWE